MPRNGSQPRICSMQVLCRLSGLMGFIKTWEPAKEIPFAVDFNRRFPLAARSVPSNAFNAGFAIASWANVHLISRCIGWPQVFNSVVAFIKVNMVNLFRQVAVMKQKDEAMLKSNDFRGPGTNADLSVASALLDCARDLSGFVPSGATAPNQSASGCIVVKKLTQKILRNVCAGKMFIAHAVVPVKRWSGKWPSDVGASLGLRKYTTI